jgi:hypothetical protein
MYQFIKITIDDRIYFFSKPHHLYYEGKLYKAFVHGSQLAWKIKNKLITYKKIKNDNNRKNNRDSCKDIQHTN